MVTGEFQASFFFLSSIMDVVDFYCFVGVFWSVFNIYIYKVYRYKV